MKEVSFMNFGAKETGIPISLPQIFHNSKIFETCLFFRFTQDLVLKVVRIFDSASGNLYADFREIAVFKNKQTVIAGDIGDDFFDAFQA